MSAGFIIDKGLILPEASSSLFKEPALELLIGVPSTTYKGSLPFNELIPLIFIFAPAPGIPEL